METDDCILVPAAQFSNDHRAIRIAVIPASLMGMHPYIIHIYIYIYIYRILQAYSYLFDDKPFYKRNFINPQVSWKKKTSVKTLFCNVPNQLKVAEGAGGAGGACNKQSPPFSYP